MTLNQDTLNSKLIEEWLNKHTSLTAREKDIFINNGYLFIKSKNKRSIRLN